MKQQTGATDPNHAIMHANLHNEYPLIALVRLQSKRVCVISVNTHRRHACCIQISTH